MNLQQLEYFVAAAEELNLTRAAQRCFVSRQALGHAVKQLEASLRVELIIAGRDGISLSPAGKKLLARGKDLLERAWVLERDMLLESSLLKPLVVIISDTLLPLLEPRLLEILRALKSEVPGLLAGVRELANDEVAPTAVREGGLGFLVADNPSEPNAVFDAYRRLPLRLSMRVDHPLYARHTVTLADLDGLDIGVPGDPQICMSVLTAECETVGVHPRFHVVSGNSASAYLVQKGAMCFVDVSLPQLSTTVGLRRVEESRSEWVFQTVKRRGEENPAVGYVEEYVLRNLAPSA